MANMNEYQLKFSPPFFWAQYWAHWRTLEVESHKCACLFIHVDQRAIFDVNFVKIARKVSFGPILGQIRSNMGQKSTLKVKSH